MSAALCADLRALALDLRAANNWAAVTRCGLLHDAADAIADAARFRERAQQALWLLDDGDTAGAETLLVALLCSPREIEIRAAREVAA